MADGMDDSRREKARRDLVFDYGLTKMPELFVVECIVDGLKNSEIVDALNPYGSYSEDYVKRVVRSICKKMGVRNRTEAAVKAVLYGLTPSERALVG
jgi:DNA-binding NarL/FixJ family response regulator